MIGDPLGDGKTQPQKLLEEVIGIRNEDEKFPTILEQEQHWEDKEAAEAPKAPRKWSAARRRKFNATMAKKREEEKANLIEHPMYDYPPAEGQIKPWDKIKTPPPDILPKPKRKWSLARRRRYNERKRKQEMLAAEMKVANVIPKWAEEDVNLHLPVLKFCPECGAHLEGWRRGE